MTYVRANPFPFLIGFNVLAGSGKTIVSYVSFMSRLGRIRIFSMVLFGRTQGCGDGEKKTNDWLLRRLQGEPAECEPYLSCLYHITANINSKVPLGALPA
jgi:hypothetical protein